MAQPELVKSSEKTLKKSASQSESSFHYKLYAILENEEYNDIISWDLNGLRIEIKKPEALAEKLLPLYFTHKKLASFVRQLNFYGFKSQKEIGGARLYYHPLFQKGNKDLLAKMVRSKPASSKSKTAKLESAVTAAESSSHEKKHHLDELLEELTRANRLIRQLQDEREHLLREIDMMRRPGFNNYFDYEATNNSFPSSLHPALYSFAYNSNESTQVDGSGKLWEHPSDGTF